MMHHAQGPVGLPPGELAISCGCHVAMCCYICQDVTHLEVWNRVLVKSQSEYFCSVDRACIYSLSALVWAPLFVETKCVSICRWQLHVVHSPGAGRLRLAVQGGRPRTPHGPAALRASLFGVA